MAFEFDDESRKVSEFNSNYFPFGVSKVQIGMVEHDETDDGKEYIDVSVVDPEDAERSDSARLWLTSAKGANRTFNVLRTIGTHNVPEAKRDAFQKRFDAIKNGEELASIMSSFVGKECWFTKYVDPTRTYMDARGVKRQSVNKDVMGYEPKLKPELMPAQAKSLDPNDYPDDVPFPSGSQKVDTSTIPDSWED